MITVFAKGKCVGEIRRPLPLQKLSPCISPLDLPTCLLRYVFIGRMFFISIHIACRLVEMIGSASPWFETSIHIFTYTHRTTTHTHSIMISQNTFAFGKESKPTCKAELSQNSVLYTFFLLFYLQIATVLGFTWLFGFVGSLTSQEFLLALFDILTPFQGFMIFLLFICKRNTWILWKQRLNVKVKPQNSRTTRTTAVSSITERLHRDTAGHETTATWINGRLYGHTDKWQHR